MAAVQLKTFSDIYTAVIEELKIQASDAVTVGRVKRMVNETYMDLVSKHTWDWCRSYSQLTLAPYKNFTGTQLTQGSDRVILGSASAVCLQDYELSMDGSTAVYHVRSHTAGSNTLYLETAYGEASQTAATVKCYQQRLALPPDCLQVIQVVSPYMETPLDLTTLLDFRRYTAAIPKLMGRPQLCAVQGATESAYYAPISGIPASVSRSSTRFEKSLTFASDVSAFLSVGQRVRVLQVGNYTYNGDAPIASITNSGKTISYVAKANLDETTTADTGFVVQAIQQRAAEQEYREMLVHPALSTEYITLSVDYKRRVPPLDQDTDEPWIPLEDRVVLKDGTLRVAWETIMRNPEAAQKSEQKYDEKWVAMKGKLTNMADLPRLTVNQTYLESKRRRNSRYRWRRF